MLSVQQKQKKVYVAMSGGVDSSVAALLLKRGGYDVTGVFMKPWSPYAKASERHSDYCLWKEDREDAMKVAAKLNIPLLTWDFSKEYKKEVADYMIREYKIGRTPNPDIMCNKHIKFGLFLKKVLEKNADYIATGHYVKKINKKLRVAKDKDKDQSYFLWTLTQEQLKHCLFPIGNYTKPEVRKIAKKFDLPIYNKKDSQGVCFIGPLNVEGFLKIYIKPKRGDIIDNNGNIIGEHDGAYYYTIGQRHGLNIGNGAGPYYVIEKDLKKNVIYVGREKDLLSDRAIISNINWLNNTKLPAKIEIKIRYRAQSAKATLSKNGSLKFKKLQKAITSGQSAVFYRGGELLGGGIIQS